MARSEEEFYAHLLAHPEDEAMWLVFGDWLLERGDARGELIVREHALRDEPALTRQYAVDELARRRLSALVGELAALECRYGFRRGHIYRAHVRAPKAARSLKLLAAHPASRLLEAVMCESAAGKVLERIDQLLSARPVTRIAFGSRCSHKILSAAIFSRHVQLELLHLGGSGIRSIETLSQLTRLRSLSLWGTVVSELSPSAVSPPWSPSTSAAPGIFETSGRWPPSRGCAGWRSSAPRCGISRRSLAWEASRG